MQCHKSKAKSLGEFKISEFLVHLNNSEWYQGFEFLKLFLKLFKIWDLWYNLNYDKTLLSVYVKTFISREKTFFSTIAIIFLMAEHFGDQESSIIQG